MSKKREIKNECISRSLGIIKEFKRINFYISGGRYYDAIKTSEYVLNTYKIDKLRKKLILLSETEEKKGE